jgi:hypothetical protein
MPMASFWVSEPRSWVAAFTGVDCPPAASSELLRAKNQTSPAASSATTTATTVMITGRRDLGPEPVGWGAPVGPPTPCPGLIGSGDGDCQDGGGCWP